MTKNFKTQLLSGAAVLFLGLANSTAFAQETETARLDEIIVTATKRVVSLQDVPQSITSISGKALSEQGIENYEDLTRTVPGIISTGGSNFNKFVVRGIQTSNGTSSSGEQKLVTIYLDDLPLTSFSVLTPDIRPYDIERIEVLRGPQGTLYGSGSLAGAIRYITKKADASGFDSSLEVDIGVTEGGAERKRLSGMVNIPLVDDKLAARVVGYLRKEDGWVNSLSGAEDINTADDWGVRGSLRWTPNDKFAATLMVTSDHNEVGDSSLYDPALGINVSNRDFPFKLDVDVTSFNVALEYDFGWAQLTSSTVFAAADTEWNLDLDGILTNVLPYYLQETLKTDTIVEELRLVSSHGGKFDWVAGAYYLDQKTDYLDVFNMPVAFLSGLGITGLTLGESPNADVTNDIRYKKNYEAALFGEVNYHITDTLTVTGGLRVSQYEFVDEGRGLGFSTPGLFPAIFGAFAGLGGANVAKVPNVASYNTTGKQEKTIGKLGIDWQPNDDRTYYALAAQGFRRAHPNGPAASNGGRSSLDPNDPTIIPVLADADSLWNYEVGAKTIWLDGRLRANVAAYFIDWGPMQVPLVRSSDATPYVGTVGKARSYGLETEVEVLIAENTVGGFNLTLQNAEVTDLTPEEALISGAIVGAQLSSPDVMAGGFLKHTWHLGSNAELYGRLDAQYVGSYANAFPNTAGIPTPNPFFAIIPSYANFNASIGWSKDNISAVLYVENLTNHDGVIFIDAAPYSLNRYSTLRPRTIGMRLNWSY